jgi:hypothetical protein
VSIAFPVYAHDLLLLSCCCTQPDLCLHIQWGCGPGRGGRRTREGAEEA